MIFEIFASLVSAFSPKAVRFVNPPKEFSERLLSLMLETEAFGNRWEKNPNEKNRTAFKTALERMKIEARKCYSAHYHATGIYSYRLRVLFRNEKVETPKLLWRSA